MVEWEHALNAHILAVALAVSEVTATNEMAEAAQAAWTPDLGEKPTVRAIRDQMRKLAADKKPKAVGKASGTTRAATKAKGKKRALDEAAAQEVEAAEPGAADEGAGPDADEEVEPAPKKQKRKKAVGGKKI